MAQNKAGTIATKDDLDTLWAALGSAMSELSAKIHKAKLQLDTLTDTDLGTGPGGLGYPAGADGLDLIRSAAGELDAAATYLDTHSGAAHRIWGAGFS